MTRQLKFRAWNTTAKCMYPAEHFGLRLSDGMLLQAMNHKSNGDPSEFEVNLGPTMVVMQFIGLLDKNGKEIYEGDILSMSHHTDEPKGVVEYDLGAFRLIRFKLLPKHKYLNNMYLFHYTKRHVIIGNIYENADLLQDL